MFYVKQNESTAARRRVPILMVDATDGATPETGLFLYTLVSKNGGTFASAAGTFTETGYGQYFYQFDTSEIDTLGFAGIHVTAVGARNYDAITHITAYDAYVGSFIAPTDVWNADISSITSAGTAGSQLNLAALPSGAGITAGDVWEYDISGVTGAGLAGSQVNLAATGITAGDVWNYSGTTEPATVKETLESANTNASNASAQTGPSAIRDAVWDTDLSYLVPSTQAAGWLYSASVGATTAAEQVWNYDISAISGAGLAGTQLNLAAIPVGAGITSGDVWSYSDRTITGGSVTSVVDPVEITTAAMAGVANTVWTVATRTITGGIADTVTSVTNTVDISTQSITDIWSEDISAYSSPSAGFDLTQAASGGAGITAGDVWEYDISAISTAGSAGTQLNLAALPSAGNGLTAYDVWSFDYLTDGVVANSAAERLEDTRFAAQNASSNTSNIGEQVWTYNPVYGGPIPAAGGYLIQAGDATTTAASDIWNYDISAITTAGTAGSQLNLAALPSAGAGLTSGDVSVAVWDADPANYSNNSTFGKGILRSDNAGVAGTVTVWSGASYNGVYADTYRIDASYEAATALKDILTGVGSSITGNITGDVSGSVGSVTSDVNVSTTSMSGIANTVWSTDISSYTAPSAGYDLSNVTAGGGITAYDVWAFDYLADGVVANSAAERLEETRTESYTANTNITAVPFEVWNYDISSRDTAGTAGSQLNLAAIPSGGAGITAGDVWNFNITGFGATNSAAVYLTDTNFTVGNIQTYVSTQTPQDVWTYAGIEGRTITGGIADTVTTVSNGVTVTTNNDKTGYALSGTQSFNLTGNITGNLSGSVGSVTSDVPVNEATISADVWGYVSRTLTSGAGISAGDVWSYPTRTVTGGAIDNATVSSIGASALTSIADKVWRYQVEGFVPPYNAGEAGYVLGNIGNEVWSWAIYQSIGAPDSAADYLSAAAFGTTSNAPAEVWSYATRTITGGTANTVTNAVLVDPASMSGIANTVWSTDVSGYTSPSAGYDLSNATAGGGITAGDVWQYATRTITGGIADTVTTVVDGVTVTTNNDKTGYELSSTQTFNLTGNITGDLSGSVGSVTADVNVDEAAISADVWSYVTRDITGGTVDTITNDVNVSTASMTGIASTVWDYVTRTLTSGNGISAYDVWNFDPTAMTVPQAGAILTDIQTDTNTIISDISNIPNNVWVSDVSGYTNPGEAGFELTQAASGSGLTAGDVWEYDISAISTAGSAGTQLNIAASPGAGGGITAGDVWTYIIPGPSNTAQQVLDDIFEATDNINTNTSPSGIKNSVWDIDLSYLSGTAQAGGVLYQAAAGTTLNAPSEVWSYATRTLTSSAGATAGDVWSYADRTITGGSVTSVVNGVTVSTNNDKTGYSLSGTQSFNLTGNITGSVSGSVGSVTGSVGSVVSPVSVATASMSGIANTVWTAATKTITGGTVDTVTNPVGVSLNSMSGIAGTVWTYSPRTLTSGAGATAGDIWTYNISSITASGTAGATLNDASVSGSVVTIVNGPYRLTSIAEGTDGRIDILAESVQTIQLNCLDGFGQPFNVTGYAAVVNVYDVSGALAVTYTPTVDFASSGIVSFDIDTDVTGTTGRYTLVVELTAGAEVVQLGPLEILVRPL